MKIFEIYKRGDTYEARAVRPLTPRRGEVILRKPMPDHDAETLRNGFYSLRNNPEALHALADRLGVIL